MNELKSLNFIDNIYKAIESSSVLGSRGMMQGMYY